MSDYAWIIDKDHLYQPGDEDMGMKDEAGTAGPRNANEYLLALLAYGEGTVFHMHDDDGELLYSGRFIGADAEAAYQQSGRPLRDFGMPNAGATSITYPGQTGWDE